MSLYIFKLHDWDFDAQIAIRPSDICRVVTYENNDNFSTIHYRVGRYDEEMVIVEHTVQEIVDAISKNEGFF